VINSETNSILIETTNAKVLFENLAKFGCSFSSVDFEILECNVIYHDGELFIEREEFEPSNPMHTVEQVLKLRFFSVDDLIMHPIKLSSESKEMVKLYAEFLPFDYSYTNCMPEEIFSRLNNIIKKRKARFGFIIADEYNSIDTFTELKPVIDNIINNDGKLTEKIKVLVSQTFLRIEPEPFLLDMKAEIGKDKIDDKDKIFYIVTQGEVALVSKKGKTGTHGRDHYGKLLPASCTDNDDIKPMKLRFDPKHIKEVEVDGEYFYYALDNGYIYIDHFTDFSEIVFNNTFEAKTINKYATGDVNLPNTAIKVVDRNNSNDLIYEATVNSEKLDVIGSIGEHSIINACAIIVQGTTHITSTLKGDDVDIKIHKGNIDAKNVNIKDVETGSFIRGNIVHIDRALGGTIIGNEVYIKECRNNNNIIAKKIVEIKNITGENNKIGIEYGLSEDDKMEMDDLKKELRSISFKMHNDNLALKKLLEIIESQKGQKKELEEKIKSIGDITKVPIGIVNNFKQIMSRIKEYNTLFTAYHETKEMKEQIIARIKELEMSILQSYISVDRNSSNNKYTFKTLDEKTVIYKGQAEKLHLKLDEELETVKNNR